MLSAVGFRFTGHCLALECGTIITRMGLEHTTSGTADPARYSYLGSLKLTAATRNNFGHNILRWAQPHATMNIAALSWLATDPLLET